MERQKPSEGETEHELGEWFNPFKDGLEKKEIDESISSTVSNFSVRQIGEIRGSLKWVNGEGGEGKAILLTPTDGIEFLEKDAVLMEDKIGGRMLSVDFTAFSKASSYQAEIRFEGNDRVFSSPFQDYSSGDFEVSVTDPEYWINEESETVVLYVPDQKDVLDKLQVRFENIPVEKLE